jgi:hypothetical protein
MNELYDKFDRYANGQMKGPEREAFERQLAADAELAREWALYREVRGRLSVRFDREAEEAALKDTLSGLGDEYFGGKKEGAKVVLLTTRRRWIAVAAAAAAVLLLLLLWAPWQISLYDRYARHPVAAFELKSTGEQADLVEAAQAFNAGKYGVALPLLEAALQRQGASPDPEVQLITGICYLELGQSAPARDLFRELAGGESAFRNEATWYLALSWVKDGDMDRAVSLLRQIPPEADRFEEAQQLLADIEER